MATTNSIVNVNPADLEDPKDSLVIDEETTNVLSTNMYQIATYVDALKAKYIDIPDDTLTMGIYGYISELGSNILENTAVMAAEYANEAIPTQAKFERNIICHALSLGINNIRATPAKMEVYLGIPEDRLIENMTNNEFILDKNFDISIGNGTANYNYRLDYDIKIKRSKLPNGKFIYTAVYLTNTDYKDASINTNEISDVVNPYLPSIGSITVGNVNVILLTVTIRQTDHETIDKKILVSNPLQNKSLSFSFVNQLAYFYMECVEHTSNGDETHYLKCLYDGLYNTEDSVEYCNYMYVDERTIRITFNRDSYQPRENADVTAHLYTTCGDDCNFQYSTITQSELKSDRFSYNNIYMIVMPLSDSNYGVNKKSIDELRSMIPKQMLMRNSISTYTDLNNFFNSLNSDTVRLYFLQKIHNQIQRIFFCYVLLKDENNMIVPTNTVDCHITRDMFTNINKQNYVLPAGSTYYLAPGDSEANGIYISSDNEQKNSLLKSKETSGFLYMNPFLTVITKNPFVLNYYLNILDYSKMVNFDFINDKSELQFICNNTTTNPIHVYKPFYPEDEKDYYTIEVLLTQNISSDFGLLVTDEDGNIVQNNMRVLGVMYTKDSDGNYTPFRWMEATLASGDYDETSYSYTYKFSMHTTNTIDKNIKVGIDKGLHYVGTNTEATSYVANNVRFKIFILARFADGEYGSLIADNDDADDISAVVPGLVGTHLNDGTLSSNSYTLCNIYEMNTGLDMFIDYTNIMESYVSLSKSNIGDLDFHIRRMPLVRYGYFWDFGRDATSTDSTSRSPSGLQSRVSKFIKILDYRRLYVQSSLLLLEDSFGIDMKFFNTYGPSKLYNISYKKDEQAIDRINISLNFEVKYQTVADSNCASDIINYIKQYMENINYISDLHMPNLVTAIKNKFYKQIVYIKFVGLNDYGYMYQSIYKNTDKDDYLYSTTVPEFININITKDDTGNDIPDITIDSIT